MRQVSVYEEKLAVSSILLNWKKNFKIKGNALGPLDLINVSKMLDK